MCELTRTIEEDKSEDLYDELLRLRQECKEKDRLLLDYMCREEKMEAQIAGLQACRLLWPGLHRPSSTLGSITRLHSIRHEMRQTGFIQKLRTCMKRLRTCKERLRTCQEEVTSLRGENDALRECRDLAVVAVEAATAQLTAVTESVGFWQRKADGLRLGFNTLGAENIKWTTRFQEEVDAEVDRRTRSEWKKRQNVRNRTVQTGGMCKCGVQADSGEQAPRRRPTYADVATQAVEEKGPERPPLPVGKAGFVSPVCPPPHSVLLVAGEVLVAGVVVEYLLVRWLYMVSHVSKAYLTS